MRMRRYFIAAAVLLCIAAPSTWAAGSRAAAAASDSLPGAEGAPEIVFPEVSGYSTSDLRRPARQDLRLVRRGEGGPADLADAAFAIESMLRRDGHPNALVTFAMFDTSNGEKSEIRRASRWDQVTRVEFAVELGPRFLVGNVSFDGVSVFDTERLRRFFPGDSADDNPPFRRQQIENGMREVGRLYELRGYADVSVGPVELIRREAGEVLYYDITVPVDEGRLYLITDVLVRAPELSEERRRRLSEETGIRGEAYYPRKAAEGAIAIRNILGREGYLAEVDYEIQLQPNEGPGEAAGASITYTVDAGPPLVVNEIHVVPRDQEELRTRWWFLEYFIPIKPGDTANLELLNRSEDRLYALGLFRLVDLEAVPVDESGDEGSVVAGQSDVGQSDAEEGTQEQGSQRNGDAERAPTNIIIRLTEIQSRQVQVSAGWGSYELATGSVSFTDRNIFGIGRYWSTTLKGSFKTYGAETTISDSILLGPNSTIALTGSYDFRDAPAYDITTIEARLDLLFRLSSYWRIEGGYSFGLDRIGDAVEEEDVPTAAEYRTADVSVGAVRDDRDSVVLPTDGTEVGGRFRYSTAFLGSELEYIEPSFFGNYHERIFDPLVFSWGWSVVTRKPLFGEATLPLQERLFLGGSNSVRSFQLDQLGPVGESGEVIGGLTSAETTAELRLRVFESFHLAAFYDFGLVSLDALATEGTIGHAVGAGARYYLPIGPIRLDVAYNPGSLTTSDRRWLVHFAVGFSY